MPLLLIAIGLMILASSLLIGSIAPDPGPFGATPIEANLAHLAKASADHQASIRLFVDAQTKLMKLDAAMGGMFVVGLVVVLIVAWKAVGLLHGA